MVVLHENKTVYINTIFGIKNNQIHLLIHDWSINFENHLPPSPEKKNQFVMQ